jgi:glycosyltransferase XagB
MHSRRRRETAARLLGPGQMMLAAVLVLLAVAEAKVGGLVFLLKSVTALIVAFYVVFVGLKLLIWWAAAGSRLPEYGVPQQDDPALPRYTILVPLCAESNVVHSLVKALSSLRYPAEKLEILLLLEEYDTETQAAAAAIELPSQFRVIIVPDVGPRTKPKACNYGYAFATGQIVVIFDAEDRPEADQLLRAAAAFESTKGCYPRVGCVQARLSFWNPRESWVSSFYWAEYVTHFQWVLVGLTRLGLIPPLGGTSNHFRFEALEAVSRANGPWQFEDEQGNCYNMRGPWDPYNLTEDADLAFRLALARYRIGMLRSTTYEEAPDTLRKAKNQRSRWLQGYAQTGLVHMRHPLLCMRRVGWLRYIAFILLVIGTPVSLLLNPLMWAVTTLYVVARLDSLTAVSLFINGLLPEPVFYAGVSVAALGNAVLFCQKIITPLRQQHHAEVPDEGERHPLSEYLSRQTYGLTWRLLFTPLWWAFTSVSACRAMRKLLSRSGRSAWDKTPHGHALDKEAELAASAVISAGESFRDTRSWEEELI